MFFNTLNVAPIALAETAEAQTSEVMWNLYSFVCGAFGMTDTVRGVIMLISVLICMAAGYLIGSINPAIIISKKLFNEDVRNLGSGNAGTTNMLRNYGTKMAVLIFALDFAKAAIAVIIGSVISHVAYGGAVAALFVVLGHMFPIYYKFKGGKGVACTAACMLVLSPISFAIIVPIFIVTVLLTKYVSLASIISALLFPLFAYAFRGTWGVGGFIPLAAVFIAVLVVFMHRENMKRLFEGKESKTEFFKKKKKAEADEAAEVYVEKKEKSETVKEDKTYSDSDFVKCTCGRLIPVSRKKCIYCKAVNPRFTPDLAENKKKKKK